MNRYTAPLALIVPVTLLMPVATSALPIASPHHAYGIWINADGSVKVETDNCGGTMCGRVIWANETAQRDARNGGVTKLVGTELLSGFRQTDARSWVGRVFVPDVGQFFHSKIIEMSPGALKISGCILRGMICKSQIWRRA